MNNQVKLIDGNKIKEWLEERANAISQEQAKTQDADRFQFLNGEYYFIKELLVLINYDKFTIYTPPVPTIGCSECDYKGYFEYETGVVDEGTGIKEIAKEPCDCVIDPVPTIKPGDKVRHAKYGHGDVKKISAWVWFSDGPEYKAITPDDLEVVE